ncbi:Uncharacterised protein [Mycobacteroides abscessus subsp. abscessus]|nr:Uncharacterised protein [Mycobacteroides abscessus subsp. abscessus]
MVSGSTAFTVALVPTGTNAGVAISPCGVRITPVRPCRPPSSRVPTVKENPEDVSAATTVLILSQPSRTPRAGSPPAGAHASAAAAANWAL